jgi:hypothetical protein
MMPELIASRKLQDIFHYTPAPYTFALQHSDRFWRLMCRIIRGEVTYTGFLEKLGPLRLLVDAWDVVARRSLPMGGGEPRPKTGDAEHAASP